MRYFTKEWYRMMQEQFVDKNDESKIRATIDVYLKEFDKNFANDSLFLSSFRSNKFHDCDLVALEQCKNKCVIKLDKSELGLNGCAEIVFKEATVKLKEFEDQDLCWGYCELYPINNGYEFHCQFSEYGSDDRYDLILLCKDIEIID